MGGVLERMIGETRDILDAMLRNRSLTHEDFAEASSIINSRSLIPVSTDPENPLLTQTSINFTYPIVRCISQY